MAARGSLADSAETKIVLLDAAEKVFATEGIRAASLRAIQRLANLSPGVLQYHFSSREELVEALLARERAGLRQKQLSLAKRLVEEKQAPSARAIISVLADPYIDFLRSEPIRGLSYVKIIVEAIRWAPRSEVRTLVGNLGATLHQAVVRIYPNVTKSESDFAMTVASCALLFLFTIELAGRTKPTAADAMKVETIVSFAAAGMEATLAAYQADRAIGAPRSRYGKPLQGKRGPRKSASS